MTRSRHIMLVIGLVVMSISACADRTLSEAEDAVRNALLDPDSAQFRNVREVGALTEVRERRPASLRPGEEDMTREIEVRRAIPAGVCGEVNSKNRFGGYAGFRGFRYDPETGTVHLANNQGYFRWIGGEPDVSGDSPSPPLGTAFQAVRFTDYCADR